MLSRCRERLSAYAERGRTVRAVHDQPLGTTTDDEILELCRSDAALNNLWRLPGARVFCTYDRDMLGPALTHAVRRCHPEVVEDGWQRPSLAYTDAEELLVEDRCGPPLPAPPADARRQVCPESPAETREFVAVEAERLGLVDPQLDDFVVAAHEVAANGLRVGVIDTVHVWRQGARVTCDVHDYGRGLSDLLAGYRPPEVDATSGRGLWLARQLTDLLQVRTGPTGSTFRLHAVVPAQP